MMKRKITAIILSGIMASGLVLGGCSNSKKKVDDTTAQSNSNFNATGFPIVKEPITLNILAKVYSANSPVYEEYPYFKNLEQQTNIKIKWETVSGTDATQKLNLMYASGEYPDAIMGGGSVNDEEKYGVDQKILLPIDQYVNTIMPNYKKALESKNEFKKLTTATDGHMYSVMSLYEMGYEAAGHYFINKKWLDKLGLKVPKTVEELENVLIAFKTKDPNGNGKADEIPFELRLFDETTGISNIFGMYGIPDTNRHLNVDDNNKVVFTADKPEFKEGLKLLNKFYKQGLIDPEMPTQDSNTYSAKIKTGNVGLFMGWRLQSMAHSYPGIENDYICIEPISAGNKKPQWIRSMDGITIGALSVTKANKNVEATMRWVDAQMDVEMSFQSRYGLIPDFVKKNEQGKYEVLTKKPDGTAITNEMQGKQAPGPLGIHIVTGEQMRTLYQLPVQHAEKYPYIDMYKPFLQKNFINTLNYLRMSSADNDKIGRVSTDINKYVTENVIQMIALGNIDETWDKYISGFKNIGIDEYIKLYQTSMDKYNNTK